MFLEVATVNGEVLLKYANDDGIAILSHPMIPDEARDLANSLDAAIKFLVDEEALA